jgi:hypothetical protein
VYSTSQCEEEPVRQEEEEEEEEEERRGGVKIRQRQVAHRKRRA